MECYKITKKKKKRYMHLEKERKIETNGMKCKEIEKKNRRIGIISHFKMTNPSKKIILSHGRIKEEKFLLKLMFIDLKGNSTFWIDKF